MLENPLKNVVYKMFEDEEDDGFDEGFDEDEDEGFDRYYGYDDDDYENPDSDYEE